MKILMKRPGKNFTPSIAKDHLGDQLSQEQHRRLDGISKTAGTAVDWMRTTIRVGPWGNFDVGAWGGVAKDAADTERAEKLHSVLDRVIDAEEADADLARLRADLDRIFSRPSSRAMDRDPNECQIFVPIDTKLDALSLAAKGLSAQKIAQFWKQHGIHFQEGRLVD
jgi:hypothetical protein